ncbi:VapC toxin family PIN domain ribonuclease [Lewinellaceae bacterium SD302]|nr:VapC toxin family PIN domain ribonuclease [Lewinellaceae bacterium SD302]
MVTDRVAIDTNVISAALSNDIVIVELLQKYLVLFVPVIAFGEQLYGAENSAKVDENITQLRKFIEKVELLDINEKVAVYYSQTRFQLKKDGKPIPENDIWIAATCLANNLPLLTHDQHFDHVAGLEVIRP